MNRQITFTLPFAMPLQNKTDRMHWAEKKKLKHRCLLEMKTQHPELSRRTTILFEKAHVLIERHSVGTPDYGNVVGGSKYLLDCLFPPGGLRIVPDDGPSFIREEYRAVKCRRAEQKTVVTITEIKEAG